MHQSQSYLGLLLAMHRLATICVNTNSRWSIFYVCSMYLTAVASSCLICHAVTWFPQNLEFSKFVTHGVALVVDHHLAILTTLEQYCGALSFSYIAGFMPSRCWWEHNLYNTICSFIFGAFLHLLLLCFVVSNDKILQAVSWEVLWCFNSVWTIVMPNVIFFKCIELSIT